MLFALKIIFLATDLIDYTCRGFTFVFLFALIMMCSQMTFICRNSSNISCLKEKTPINMNPLNISYIYSALNHHHHDIFLGKLNGNT